MRYAARGEERRIMEQAIISVSAEKEERVTEFSAVVRRIARERGIDEHDLVDAIARTGHESDPRGVVDGTALPDTTAGVAAAMRCLGLESEAEREPLIRALSRDFLVES